MMSANLGEKDDFFLPANFPMFCPAFSNIFVQLIFQAI